MYGVRYEILKAIIEYMYLGEVHISNENLKDFIQTAESLQIRGLTKDQAIKIPKPSTEVNPSDLIGSAAGGHEEHHHHHHQQQHHFDHSLKKVVRRGGKRMRSNDDNAIDSNHMYLSSEPISVDHTNLEPGKSSVPMPKPLEKRNPYHEEGQIDLKLELDDSVDLPSYCAHRAMNQHNNPHAGHHPKTPQPHVGVGGGPPPQISHQPQLGQHVQQPIQPQQQQPSSQQQQQTVAPGQTTQQHLSTPSTSAQMITGANFDRPGTSHSSTQSSNPNIKSDYDQLNAESGQTTPSSDDDKIKRESIKRGDGTVVKGQESARVCPVCSRVYSSVSNLRQHMRLIHNPTYVCCPICQKYFNTDLYLRRHISGIHRGENIDWPPPYENNQTTPNSIC